MQPTYCVTSAHIEETIDNFFACTCLPISAFTKGGQVIYSKNLAQELINKLNEAKLTEIAYKKFAKYNCTSHVMHTIAKEDYIACYICQKDNSKGMFIIGPYDRPIDLIPYLIALIRNLQEDYQESQKQDTLPNQVYSLHVQKALNYITENYAQNITLDSMAQYLKINKCYFATIFKQETGQTFSTTLNKIRVEKSKDYLINKKFSILDVALNVGFTNQNYYGTMFKRLTSMTPSEFRQKMAVI